MDLPRTSGCPSPYRQAVPAVQALTGPGPYTAPDPWVTAVTYGDQLSAQEPSYSLQNAESLLLAVVKAGVRLGVQMSRFGAVAAPPAGQAARPVRGLYCWRRGWRASWCGRVERHWPWLLPPVL